MSNNRDFKVKNGIQPTSYFEGVGTVVSGSVGYSLANASYDSVSFSTNNEITTGANYDVAFSSDGSIMYVNAFSMSTVFQYSLSTAWDISTASYASKSYNHSGTVVSVFAMDFSADGTSLYLLGQDVDTIYQFSLSTAWDLSTSSYASKSYAVSQDNSNEALKFSSDGTKLYTGGSATDTIYQHSLSTAWDLSTASYDSVSFNASSQETRVRSLDFNSTGTKMYICGADTDTVYQYTLSTAWDLSTASYDTVNFSVAAQEANPYGFCFGDDGSKMYLSGPTSDVIYQYSTVLNTATLDLSTGSVFEVTPTSDIQVTLSNPADSGTVSGATLLLDGVATTTYDIANAVYDSVSFSVNSQEATPRGISFKPDGTKMYVTGTDSDDVHQYSLSAAFDVSTASYDSVSFSVAGQDTAPLSVQFNGDGTKMYVLGQVNDTVFQYTLSTAYDVSTASYASKSFSFASQDTSPYGITFNDDGTSLYSTGNANDTIYQYTLSTAYDVSTASHASKSFSVASQEVSPAEMVFNSDGTKMYMVGQNSDTVFEYNLSAAYDVSTATYGSVSFSVTSQASSPSSLAFSQNGDKLYVIDAGSDTIYQYSTATPATITYDTAIEWPSGTAPTSPAIGETDVITFNTRDGGTSYQAVQAIDGAS